MATTVRDNQPAHRYEISDGEHVAGFAEYRLQGDRMTFIHTEIADEYGGRGMGKELVTEALADVRRRGLAALPECPYVRKVIADDPDAYLDLVPAAERARFDLPAAE